MRVFRTPGQGMDIQEICTYRSFFCMDLTRHSQKSLARVLRIYPEITLYYRMEIAAVAGNPRNLIQILLLYLPNRTKSLKY